MNQIELNHESRREIFSHIESYPGQPEMSEHQSAFLCGMLCKSKPKNVLEVGVSGGATTAVILQCLADIGSSFKMASVDYVERFPRNHKYKTKVLIWNGKF